jgi:hypothetical protein
MPLRTGKDAGIAANRFELSSGCISLDDTAAERRETFGCSAEHPWGVHMTRDARLSALHRGGFGLPGPRFRLLRRPPSYNGGQMPSGSVQRAPRTQVVVPGGRGPCLPGRTVTSRRRRRPFPAPPSGSSPETPLNERGCGSTSMASTCSQECSWYVVTLRAGLSDRYREVRVLPASPVSAT